MATGIVKATVPVAIPPGTKLVHLYYDTETSDWVMWVHHDLQLQHGTQLVLHADGGVTRRVLHRDGSEELFRVR